MRVQLAPPAQDLLGPSDRVIITERVDEVALRSGQMVKRGCGEVLDRHLPPHGKQRRSSGGWRAVSWLADILTEGDHRQVSVEASITGMHPTLRPRTGQIIEPLDGRDDRWGHRLTPWSTPPYGPGIEADVKARRLAVDAVLQDGLRGDATPVSGAHDVTAGGRLPLGQSQDEPTRPPIKVMRGSVAPGGRPLATEVLSGERAAEG